ncbi:hypothetical protein [Bacillus sp. FJAT-42315]|uniref:hypothetical protein n=1 Tax=Bacillus sp. FJAT-42315 TaxID=2014077 RepID=UPI000C25094C|nr:hypothetical protein [Bacillus sp. FJAT-42315]
MRMLFAVCLLICTLLNSSYVAAETIDLNLKENELAITFLPLSDGEAAFLHTADGQHYLINTGTKESRPQIFSYMKKFAINQLSGLVITETQEELPPFIAQLKKDYQLSRIYGADMQVGEVKQLQPGLELEILYNGIKQKEGIDFSIKHFDSRFLWLSSASTRAEKRLLKEELKDINIVKTPNFGQNDSMSYSLLTHIDPQTAIIFTKKESLPGGELMEMLHQMWIDVYYTKQHGLIMIKCNKIGYEVLTIRN